MMEKNAALMKAGTVRCLGFTIAAQPRIDDNIVERRYFDVTRRDIT